MRVPSIATEAGKSIELEALLSTGKRRSISRWWGQPRFRPQSLIMAAGQSSSFLRRSAASITSASRAIGRATPQSEIDSIG